MASNKFTVQKNLHGLSETIVNLENLLKGNNTTERKRVMATILAEECIVKLAQVAKENTEIKVNVRRFIRKTYITIVSKGRETDLANILSSPAEIDLSDEYGASTADTVRNIVIRANAEDISYRHFNGYNVISILVARNDNMGLMDVVIAIGLAIITGLVLRAVLPENMAQTVSNSVFAPLYTVFLNAIKMIMAPLVFFSIANSVGGFTNLKELGHSGMKVFGYYTLTTILAMVLAWGAGHLFHTTTTLSDLNIEVAEGSGGASGIDVSLVDTLIHMVPDNFVDPFANSNMMQIIVMAVIIGIAMGKLGEYSKTVHNMVATLDALFGRITTLIIKFLPVAVFGSFTSLVLTLNPNSTTVAASWMGIIILCVIGMIIIYLLLLAIRGINPIQFIKKYHKVAITAISTSSSNATMPVAINCCHKMGVAPKIYNFSIPLGSTINMDGTTMYLVVSTMFLSLISGVAIPSEAYLSLGFTILLLSMAAPAVPGAAIACLSTLLAIVGIPNESIAVIIGVLPLLDPLLTASNVIGDGVVTTLVAKSEKALDMEKFKSQA